MGEGEDKLARDFYVFMGSTSTALEGIHKDIGDLKDDMKTMAEKFDGLKKQFWVWIGATGMLGLIIGIVGRNLVEAIFK